MSMIVEAVYEDGVLTPEKAISRSLPSFRHAAWTGAPWEYTPPDQSAGGRTTEVPQPDSDPSLDSHRAAAA
jgi:hypothetical protein